MPFFPVRSQLALVVVALLQPAAAPAIDFAHDVVPILRERCADCHTGDKKKGGFSMNSRGDLLAGSENGKMVVAGKSAESKLVELLTTSDADSQMPPSDAKQKRLSAEKVAVVRAWIDEGAKWQDGFAFKKPSYEPPLKPRRPELPAVVDGRAHPIDRILDAYLAQHGKPRPQPLDDAAFARRVHLDLIGLLPEPAALEKFLADPAPDKRTRLVQSLLGRDVDYAEHWLTFWNDLLRNDYSRVGFGPGTGAPVTRWLYNALLTNKPYDQFVRELIAPPTPESAGFSAGLAWRGTVSASQTREVQFAQSMGQAFLGINMKCASCHDSFIDRWKLSEAYGLAAIYATQPVKIARCDKETGAVAKAAWIFPELGDVKADAPQPERLKQLAALMTHEENGRFTRTIVNRLWHRLMGRGIVHPVDAMQTEPWSADLLDFLAVQFRQDGCDLRKALELICTSQAYQSRAVVRQKDDNTGAYVFSGPRGKRMTAEQFIDAVWTLTGTAPERIDAPLLRGFVSPEVVKNTRIEAQWIWQGEEPAENAGEGGAAAAAEAAAKPNLVALDKTPDATPTAARPSRVKIRNAKNKLVLRQKLDLPDAPVSSVGVWGQDVGGVNFLVNGAQYQNDRQLIRSRGVTTLDFKNGLRKGANEILVAIDKPAGKTSPPGFALQIQMTMRDGTTALIGTDATWEWSPDLPTEKAQINGPEAKDAQWFPVAVVPAKPRHEQVRQPMIEALAHASQPQPPARASLMKSDLLQRALGRPNREQIVSMRPEDLTTLEALDLANGDALGNALAAGAKKLATRNWDSPGALTGWIYRAALARPPSPDELTTARQLLGEKPTEPGVQDLLWAVCMLPEFQIIR
ncbi:MAG: DUF1549 domain-containing protein [Chthoniobacteraceae bacterium]